MATYYRWRKSTLSYEEYKKHTLKVEAGYGWGTIISTIGFSSYKIGTGKILDKKTGIYSLSNITKQGNIGDEETVTVNTGEAIVIGNQYVEVTSGPITFEIPPDYYLSVVKADIYRELVLYESRLEGAGIFLKYVYSLNASEYPTDGQSGDYWYDQRTTITSPTAPSNVTCPAVISQSPVQVTWDASTSNVPDYPVTGYEVGYSINGGSWVACGTTADTSLSVSVPMTAPVPIQFRVKAQDANGQWSTYTMGNSAQVLPTPVLTVPSLAMQGQEITVNWTSVEGSTSYTLQRKANTDTDWVEVYTGQDLEFTEEVGTWSTVQYRVQAVFSVGPGGWGTSKVIPVVSASALVISGQDGDLGTLTADVPYTVSTDTGKPITVERKVNGQVVASIEASSNFAYDIPIYDLPTGAGTITLTCSVTPDGQDPVQAERKWTYYKAPVLFPQAGSTAQITKEGKNVYPLTIAEAVRTPQYMGGSLDKTLELMEEILNTAVISVGTYVGTGTSGQSAPNRLRFMSPPTVVTVYGEGRVLSISNTEPTGGQTDAYIQGNEAIWYNISADKQLNESGKTYTYFAAGKRV